MKQRLALTVAGGLLLVAAQAGAQQLTIAEWGDIPSKAGREAMWDPYTAATGVVVKDDVFTGELAKIRAQVESGAVTWDIAGIEDAEVGAGCDEGILQQIDASKIPVASDLPKDSISSCGIAYYAAGVGLAYDESAFPNGAPKTWADFFDTKKFPGKRGMRQTPTYTLEVALLADGVPLDQVYDVLVTKEGQDRAFAKLDTIKSDIVWWTSGSALVQGFVANEYDMSIAYHGRVCNTNKSGQMKLGMAWDAGYLMSQNFWVVPTGSPNLEAAEKFMSFALQPEAQANFMRISGYVATNPKAFDLLSEEEKACMPGTPERAPYALYYSDVAWRDNFTDLSARFNNWLAN